MEALDQNPEIVLCYPRTVLIDEHGQIINMDEDKLELDSPDVVVRFSHTLSPIKLCHNPVFGVIRKDALAKTRLIGPYLASDRCLVAELSILGPFRESPEQLFYRRKRPGNIGTSLQHVKFYDPSLHPIFVLPEWRVSLEHLKSVKRSTLTPLVKIHLILAILHWVCDQRLHFITQLKRAVKQFMKEYAFL